MTQATEAPLRLAFLQTPSPMGDIALGLATLTQALQAAGAAGARMLVAPETYLPGYNQPDVATRALPRDGDWADVLSSACRDAGCGLCVGYAERDGGRVHNAALAFSPTGQRLADYRKIQLYGPREKAIYTPGDAYTTFDLDGVKTAILICYDVEFAPHVAALAAQGVTLILTPTANMEPFHHVVRATVPAMAANHAMRIVYANYCGVEGDLTYLGGSLVAAEDGSVVAQAGRGPALIIADMPENLNRDLLYTQAADYRPIT
ncbi:MAG: carbon-nitrogen hydrolase family protein [Pseudomonadota bacterium]